MSRQAWRTRCPPLLHDEPTRISSCCSCPWIMHACHTNASCHLGVARTLSMLERFYWWIGMDICTQWWLRRCPQCQARTSSRKTVRWPILSLPLPSSPSVAVTSMTSALSLLHLGETPTYHSLRIYSTVAQTCTPSLLQNSRLKAPPTSWSTSIHFFGGIRPVPLR